jgi:hypothetical protein
VFVSVIAGVTEFGATLYCGPSSTGSASGADFNNRANFNSLTYVRGNTYKIIEGNYTLENFNTAASGTTLITIQKVSAADGAVAGYSSTLYDSQAVFPVGCSFTSPYWLVDGVSRSGLRSGHGIKFDNSVSQTDAEVLDIISGSHHVTLKYVEVAGSARQDDTINDRVLVMDSTHDTTVQYCYIHDSGEVTVMIDAADDTLIEQSVIERNDSSAMFHAEGFVVRGGSDRTTIRYNIISDMEGTAFLATPSGSHHTISDLFIYGNVFNRPSSPSRGGVGDGIMSFFDVDVTGKLYIFNNTFYNERSAIALPFTNPKIEIGGGWPTTVGDMQVKNNLWERCDGLSPDGSAESTTFAWTFRTVVVTRMEINRVQVQTS